MLKLALSTEEVVQQVKPPDEGPLSEDELVDPNSSPMRTVHHMMADTMQRQATSTWSP